MIHPQILLGQGHRLSQVLEFLSLSEDYDTDSERLAYVPADPESQTIPACPAVVPPGQAVVRTLPETLRAGRAA